MEGGWVRHGTWLADPTEPGAAGANCHRFCCSPWHAARGHSVPVVSVAQWCSGGWSGVCGREWHAWHGNTASPLAVQSARLGQG
jgi:hypothetical protein